MLPGRKFPFPKSLYAVEDTLRLAVGNKPDALVLDFFAGSGTTTHAVARLNHMDRGRRRSISITNNEVSEEEARELHASGYAPGDPEWEALGIFEHITRPRIEAAVTGKTPESEPVEGDYKFVDEFPMAQGLEENVEFFELTYLDPNRVARGKAFHEIAPLLWMLAGAQGPRIEEPSDTFALSDGARYGVLFNPVHYRAFAKALDEREDVTHAFVVTDSHAQFQQIVTELPAHVDVSML